MVYVTVASILTMLIYTDITVLYVDNLQYGGS